ncbi:Type I restriction modification DNA specificity domain [Corynebacterium variabile]|uniref:Type I restriction modification DNA specificity domain n=2 Tax=Corynebacterium variabile TaxID=1727 RepID=A0A0X2NLW3_9CORY|nr:Type I restriction modification DNA specificity domain [Corynebacterium variabile]
MSAANHGIIVETAEGISIEASESARRLNALPSGSVFLSARGTVGLVTTNTIPCAINQSAYAFIPPEGKGPALRLAIESLVDRLRARAHGSTFSTITKQDLRESSIPDLNSAEVEDLCPVLNDLEELRIAKAKESRTLAATRDELLPLLMSGKITVADAEKRIAE